MELSSQGREVLLFLTANMAPVASHQAYITIFLLLSLQKELQNLEDAGDELLMLENDTAPIPYPYFLF